MRVAEPIIPEEVAVILAVPGETPVANPAGLTAAMAGAEEVRVAVEVRFCVLLSLYVPMAMNCCAEPRMTEAVLGVTAIDTRVWACANDSARESAANRNKIRQDRQGMSKPPKLFLRGLLMETQSRAMKMSLPEH